jgi:formylmethanofuran dehydrogenase subunit C
VRYNSNGGLDTGLGKVTVDVAGGDDFALDVALDGGKIVVAGQARTGAGYDFALARIRTN